MYCLNRIALFEPMQNHLNGSTGPLITGAPPMMSGVEVMYFCMIPEFLQIVACLQSAFSANRSHSLLLLENEHFSV